MSNIKFLNRSAGSYRRFAATNSSTRGYALRSEVLSQAVRRVQTSFKLAGYFRLPSVAHYLIVDPTQPSIIHHARGTGDTILTRVITEGRIALDPPGLGLDLADIYQGG